MELPEVLEAIAAGEFDGHLDEIAAASVQRVHDGAVQFMWRLRYDGDEWTQQSVTLAELKFVEACCWVEGFENGRPWRRRATRFEIDPRLNAEYALALIIAHLHKAQGVKLEDATKRAGQITAAELDEIVGELEVVRPPKDDSPLSTSTSPTA